MQTEQLREAIELIKSNQFQEAEKILDSLLKTDPNNEIAWLWLVMCKTNDKDKVNCLEQALRINPKNENVKKALNKIRQKIEISNKDSFEDFESIHDETPKLKESIHGDKKIILDTPNVSINQHRSVEFIPAVCPKCGGELRVPDNLEKAICLYCGVSFIIRDNVTNPEKIINNYLDLLTIAIENNNFAESFQFANKILEIDSKNQQAWIYKGYAHGALAIEHHFLNEPDWGQELSESRNYIIKGLTINLPKVDESSKISYKYIRKNADQELRLLAAKLCYKITLTANAKVRRITPPSQSTITDQMYIDYVHDILHSQRDEETMRGKILAYEALAYLLLKDDEYVKIWKNGAKIDRYFIENSIIRRMLFLMKSHFEIYHSYDDEPYYLRRSIYPSLLYYYEKLPWPPWFWFDKELSEGNLKIKKIIEDYNNFGTIPDYPTKNDNDNDNDNDDDDDDDDTEDNNDDRNIDS